MSHPFLDVPLSLITDSNRFDIHPYLKDIPPSAELHRSIEHFGLLHPPTLVENGSQRKYDIISGRQRLKCLTVQGSCHSVISRVLPASSTIRERLSFLLEDQHLSEKLNLIEQACFLEICGTLIPDKVQRLSYLESLPQGRITKGWSFLQSFAQLPDTVKRRAHFQLLSEKVLKTLSDFSAQEQETLSAIIEDHQMGTSNQRIFLEETKEYLLRQHIGVNTLINREDIRGLISRREGDTAASTTRLLQHLFALNHPNLSQSEQNFKDEVDALRLPKECTVSHSPAFEKDEITLKIKFKNLAEFRKLVGKSPLF